MVEPDGASSSRGSASAVEADPGTSIDSRQGPANWILHALIVFASVLAILSGVNVWVERQVLDTGKWVETSDDLLANDEVRGVVAAYLVDELYEAVDIAEELDIRLPDSVDALAGFAAAALRAPATEAVDRLLASDVVREEWSDLNRVAHERFVRILTDDTGPALSTDDGTVTLDLGELVELVGEEFGLSGDVLDRLPEDVGVIIIAESDELATAQDIVRVVEVLSMLLFLLVLVLYGAAIYLAGPQRRRRTIRDVGVALALSGGVVLVARRIALRAAEGAGDTGDAGAAAGVATGIGTDLLHDMALAGLAYGLLIVGFAALTGPSGLATWLRKLLAPTLVNKPVGTWLSAIAIFLFVLYVLPGEPLESWWRGAIFVALFALALDVLRRQLREEFPNASLIDSWETFRDGVAGLRSSPSE